VHIHDTNWSGGTKNDYVALVYNPQKKERTNSTLKVYAPWENPVEGQFVELTKNRMLVCHSYFCGNDMGVTIYAHVDLLPNWIPANTESWK